MSNNIVKPSILPGFLELTPTDQILFNKMLDTIRANYEKFGFLPIDTPVIEKSEVLLAKGGGETEKQIYRFEKGSTDMSLRFDLTVPLARYVAQHYSELSFPFRRYHIGKVYRGERNQKGRFREFYQCDIDIIGNGSLDIINDAEIPSLIYSTFRDLDFGPFTIKINNRKMLKGFFQSLGIDDATFVLRAVDKLDKIGIDGVEKELLSLEFNEAIINRIKELISIEGSNKEIINKLEALGVVDETFKEGLDELSTVIKYIDLFGVPEKYYKIELSMVRGLDYYTGTVYETVLDDYPSLGSICGGGRYENLAGYYTKQKLPGVGMSIGLSRLFYQLIEAKIIEAKENSLTKVLIIPMDGFVDHGVYAANILRNEGIHSQIYLESGKIGKIFNYADKLKIPYVIVIGQDEATNNTYSFRNMKTGEQKNISIDEVLECLKS
ncbi:histidine--tRNA ligase [Tissierella sp.]|uniref:histidine--tRNA ligase n=1 Tax=Tissierella sp. TaxID=41274 RepID=UPI002861BF4B|nr:histidine--tRNA ligase [Tissierella sp.]MDR7856470.1 histidine--tRNA ligase [Tissierella sp.]